MKSRDQESVSDRPKEQTARSGGIRLRMVNFLMIIAAVVMSFLLLISTYRTTSAYTEMREATDTYINCNQQMMNMQDASDYLTEQVRSFVVTGDIDCMKLYFEEADVTKRRDTAVAYFQLISDDVLFRYIENAMRYSTELMDQEYHAMKLAAQAREIESSLWPETVREYPLPKEDENLSDEEKLTKATELVFGETYQSVKRDIYDQVEKGVSALTDQTRTAQVSSSDRLLKLLREQYMLIAMMLLSVFFMVIITLILVIVPLNRAIGHIKAQQQIPAVGSYELQYLANTYNQMAEMKKKEQDQLSYEASHDPLTGLYNRSVFTRMNEEGLENSALLLVDIDYFKGINDTYGHTVGDMILKKVADTLQHSFRSEDYVCRLGGDEFAVIMVHADSSLKELITGKVTRAAQMLRAEADGLPGVTLSIGIAFSDRENPSGDLYHDADVALYEVKEKGRNGFGFYEGSVNRPATGETV